MTAPTSSSPTQSQPRGSATECQPRGRQAAAAATARNSTRVDLPFVGTVALPPPQQLAYLGGIAALIALDVIEWPVGLVVAAGHVFAANTHNKIVQDFGDALEEA
jgi:hypothetical protein